LDTEYYSHIDNRSLLVHQSNIVSRKMANMNSPTSQKVKYTPPHLRAEITSPQSPKNLHNTRECDSMQISPSNRTHQTPSKAAQVRKLSPQGNTLWTDMLDDDTLPDPMADIVMDSLKDNTMEERNPMRHPSAEKDHWQISRVTSDQYTKEHHTPNQAMTKLLHSMMVEPTMEQHKTMNRNWSLAMELHNNRLR
jgi:hypothetical protein